MCGRVRLSTDYSEIKIGLNFNSAAPAPNMEASWNHAAGRADVGCDLHGGRQAHFASAWGLLPAGLRTKSLRTKLSMHARIPLRSSPRSVKQ